jgi:hypothetical protein
MVHGIVPAKLRTCKSDGFVLSGKRSHRAAAHAHDAPCSRHQMDLERRRVGLVGWILGRHMRSGQDQLPRQGHSFVFRLGAGLGYWLPSHGLISSITSSSSKYQPARYSPAPNTSRQRSSVQKEAMAEPATTNNRTGVPSTGAEDIGRGSVAIMMARSRFLVGYADHASGRILQQPDRRRVAIVAAFRR